MEHAERKYIADELKIQIADQLCSIIPKSLKYVIVFRGHISAVVFPEWVSHSDVVNSFTNNQIVSAGFCRVKAMVFSVTIDVWGCGDSIRIARHLAEDDPIYQSNEELDPPVIQASLFSGPWDYMFPHPINQGDQDA